MRFLKKIIKAPMIAGVLLYNQTTEETLFRSPMEFDDLEVQDFIDTFKSTPKDNYGHFLKSLNYVYTFKNEFYICVITTYPPYIVNELINLYSSVFVNELFDNIQIIDDTLNEYTFFVIPQEKIQEYQRMESQEEALHDLVKKSKEIELQKRLKQIRKRQPTPIDFHLEKVKELELEIRKPIIEIQQKKEIKEIFRENKRKLEIDSNVQIFLKEKLKVEVNKENKIINCEMEGDLSLFISNEEFKFLEIQIESEMNLKFSPNLEKEMLGNNLLKSLKGFPVNKNVALVKWNRNKLEELPVSFTFWPSDLEDGRFQILFEISAEENLKDLMFCFNKEKLKDVFIETGKAEIKDYLEWNVGDINKGENQTLEFTCCCSSPNDIFPVNLFFSGNFFSSPLIIKGIKKGEEDVEFGLQKLCEVDSFRIVDE